MRPARPVRVLVVCWGWHSHLRPLLPVAYALRAAGHAVTLAVPPSLLAAARASGLPAAPVGRDIDAAAVFRTLVLPGPADRPAPKAAAPTAAPTATATTGVRAGPPRALRVFLDAADAMLDDLVALGRARVADLVLYEPTALAGPLCAAALGVPAARHLYGPDLLRSAHAAIADALAPAAARLGITGPVDPAGQITVDPCPDALADPADPARLRVRHPAPAARPAARPGRVVVTWGATMALLDGRFMLAGRYARALADRPHRVVLVAAPQTRALAGDLPATVRVVGPQELPAVLCGASAVVSQGGAATVLTGLAAGVPQVVVGQLPDHLAIGRRVARAGAGLAFTPDRAGDGTVRDAVEEVLRDPAYRRAARGIALANAARPAPEALVTALCELARGPGVVHSGG